MTDMLRQNWLDLLGGCGVNRKLGDPTFEDICKHYTEPGRFYHTLNHAQNVLEDVESLGSYARNLNAVKMAAWLHDVIYDTRASDNEERSAEYAEQVCNKLTIPDGRVVPSLILKTKTHEAGDDPDAQVLLDADLAILGASEPGLPHLRPSDTPGVRLDARTRIPDGQTANPGAILDQTEDL